MLQRHLIVVDEQSQEGRLKRLCDNLKADGIELIYKEINPSHCTKRQDNGDKVFDADTFTQVLSGVPFLDHLDVFATDYNLIEGQLKGIDVVCMFNKLKPFYRKRMVIYSAQIETVIGDILEGKSFDEQQVMLKLITQHDIEYMTSDGAFENSFKRLIEKEPNISLESRLAESMYAIDGEDICCAIPPFDKKSLTELANLLLSRDEQSVLFKKEIADHILACITSVKTYE